MSNADAGRYLKEWRAPRDNAGFKIAATPTTITEQALRLAGTVWEEAVGTATAEYAIIEKAWRDETAHKDREINELTTDLDTATGTHKEAVKELQTRIEESNQAARDNAAAATEVGEQLTVAARKHAEDNRRVQEPARGSPRDRRNPAADPEGPHRTHPTTRRWKDGSIGGHWWPPPA